MRTYIEQFGLKFERQSVCIAVVVLAPLLEIEDQFFAELGESAHSKGDFGC